MNCDVNTFTEGVGTHKLRTTGWSMVVCVVVLCVWNCWAVGHCGRRLAPPTSWDLQHILGLVTPRTSGPSFPLLLGLRISRVWMSSRLVVQLQGTSSLCCSPKYLSTISTKIIILLTLLLIFPKYNSLWSTRQKIFVVKTKQPSQTRLGAAESRATAWCLILLRSYIIPFCNTHPGRSVEICHRHSEST